METEQAVEQNQRESAGEGARATVETGHAPSLLPLDAAERVVSFKHRGWPYSFIFPRITAADWERFFSGISISSQNEGKVQTTVVDLSTAGMALVESKVERVEGYQPGFLERPEWKTLLPVGHVKAAAELLRQVALAKEDTSRPIDPLSLEVTLEAAWNSDKPGSMAHYSGLVHRFNPPTAEHRRKHNRAMSEMRVVGGSRAGRTIYIPRQQILSKFYDELVISVEGFAVGGRTLADPAEIKREMDAYHKVVAVQQLFETPDDLDSEGEAEEVNAAA